MSRVRVALVGAGSMATNHAHVIADSNRAVLSYVVDRDVHRAEAVARAVGAIATTDLSRAFDCDAAVVATTTTAHAATALKLVEIGLPLLVEKPLTPTMTETRNLVDAATAHDVVLMCGLVERFNPAVAGLRDSAHDWSHIRTLRISPPPRRVHSGVVDDVLLHDLDLLLTLVPDNAAVDIHAIAHHWNRRRDWPEAVTCRLGFANGMTASLHASRVAARRARAFVITDHDGDERSLDLLGSRGGALAAQFDHFLDLVRDGTGLEREAERASVLPAHALAHRVQDQLVRLPACTF